MPRAITRPGRKAQHIRTKNMVLDWYGEDLIERVNRAGGEGMARGARILGEAVKWRLAGMATEQPGGWGWWKMKWGPGYMARETRWGKFQTGTGFTGGFVRLLGGVWHLVEFGTGSSRPRPFLKPTIADKKAAILTAVIGEIQGELERAA